MFCPSCGAESSLELNYCSRCGANMASAIAPVREIVPISLTKPVVGIGLIMTLITLGGFAIVIGGAITLAQVFRQSDPVIAIIMMGMLTILASDVMLVRLLSRIIRTSLETKQTAQPLTRPQGREEPRQLGPGREPVHSVTEHTTRTFSPAFREASDRGTK
jgi:hypothetical protein